jgi:D-alanine-D-alanine ligase-like ATP-grasp enzyme
VRKPPAITGTGRHSIRELIKKHNRRRMAATGGESFIPDDAETLRCLNKEGLDYETVLENGRIVVVRKTANLHTGGTIHDVTDEISPALKQAGDDYAFIEANERPGLANHEPQPTAQRFIDLLFPETVTE